MAISHTNKRIAFVANTSWSLYNFRLGLLKRLKELGFEVVIIAPTDHYSAKLIAEGFSFYPFPFESYAQNPLRELFGLYRLIKTYYSIKPDLIFHYTVKPNVYGSISAWLLKIPSIAITTGLGVFRASRSKWRYAVLKKLYTLTGVIAKEIWFLNEDDREYFLDCRIVKEGKTRLLPSEGVNISWFAPNFERLKNRTKKAIKFLFIGRIVWSKGVREFYEAATIIKQKTMDANFDMIGFIVPEHPDGVSLKEIQAWQRSKCVNYLGETNDIRPFIEHADCIVLPSYHEGVSRVLLEAASMAKPIIASNVVGCKEVVEHGVNGLLCEVRNTDDLVNKMELFKDLPQDERYRMGLAGRKKVLEKFDEELIFQYYLDSIRAILKIKNSKYVLSKIFQP